MEINIKMNTQPRTIQEQQDLDYREIQEYCERNNLSVERLDNGEASIINLDGICKHCFTRTCKERRIVKSGKSFKITCDKRDKSYTTVFTSVSDSQIISTIGKHKIASCLNNNLSKYTSCLDFDVADMFIDMMYDILRRKGSYIFIYNGSTCLWEKNETEGLDYILSKYSTVIINELVSTLDKIIAMNSGDETTVRTIDENLERERQVKTHQDIRRKFLVIKNKMLKRNFSGNVAKTLANNKIIQEMELMSGDPDYFPISGNRVINLKTGEIELRKRYHYFQFEIDVDYLGRDYKSPHMTAFVKKILDDDMDKVKCIQELLGYCLSGDTAGIGLNIFTGGGGNGKTALIELLLSILGEFAVTLMNSALMGKTGTGATPELIPLVGARFAVVSETSKGEGLNDSMMKKLTGGDSIGVRELYSKPFTFKNKAKLVLLTNHAPEFNPSAAELRRIKLFKFNRFFVAPDKYIEGEGKFLVDLSLEESLKTEHINDVFTFFVNGCINYFQKPEPRSFYIPESFKKDMDEYVEDNDHMGRYIDEFCVKDTNHKIKSSEFLRAVNEWCVENGIVKYSAKSLKDKLTSIGFTYKKISNMYIVGITLKNFVDCQVNTDEDIANI